MKDASRIVLLTNHYILFRSLLGMMEERVLEELGRKMVNNGLKEKN